MISDADEGRGEELRAGKPRDQEEVAESRHTVGREEHRGLHGLEKRYNLVVVGAGLSGAVVAERASKLLGLKSLVIDKGIFNNQGLVNFIYCRVFVMFF